MFKEILLVERDMKRGWWSGTRRGGLPWMTDVGDG
jgi:hypothetical protein